MRGYDAQTFKVQTDVVKGTYWETSKYSVVQLPVSFFGQFEYYGQHCLKPGNNVIGSRYFTRYYVFVPCSNFMASSVFII
jgi:hypothetical protein